MTSLRQRLHRVLLILLGGLFLQWVLADRAIVYLVEREMESRLRHDADTLLATVAVTDAGRLECDSQAPGTIYSREYSGHYYVIAANGRRTQSASFGTSPVFDPPNGPPESLNHLVGPRGQPLLVLTTHAMRDGQPIALSLGEDLSPMRRELTRFRMVFLLVSLAVVACATAFQERELRWALRPLVRIREAVQRVREHGAQIEVAEAPTEVRPLVDEINRLLSFVDRRLRQSRTAIGNLSHAVKTPLTAVFRLLDDSRIAAFPGLQQQLQEQARAIQVRIDRELKRARLAGDAPTAATFDPQEELPALVQLLTHIHREKQPAIEWVASPGPLPFDRQDMMELIGNLADNACKWARHRVRIEIRRTNGLTVLVSDDGPGCSSEQLESLGTRGHRVDESVPGSGLGLAIAKEIVEFSGGSLVLARSTSLGGLEVTAQFPPKSAVGEC
jgi:signal transduction histidine kinase